MFPQPPNVIGCGDGVGLLAKPGCGGVRALGCTLRSGPAPPWLRPLPDLQKRLRERATDACLAHMVGCCRHFAHSDLLRPPSRAVVPWAAEETQVWMLVQRHTVGRVGTRIQALIDQLWIRVLAWKQA